MTSYGVAFHGLLPDPRPAASAAADADVVAEAEAHAEPHPRTPPSWRELLLRPLAVDEHRAQFWVRHVRIGVVLTELTVLLVAGYALSSGLLPSVAVAVVAALVAGLSPLIMLLPIRRWCLDQRGALLFYLWSTAATVLIAVVVMLDGGATSPLLWLLVLTLTYAAMAYPPTGVALMGGLMTCTHVGIVLATPAASDRAWAPAVIFAVYTVLAISASRNQWHLVDQQRRLAQRMTTLADTDQLTGCLSRRAFDRRLIVRLAAASDTHPVSLCVLDLDRFKLVNDTDGHAAGDRVLVLVARALLAAARETDSVSRLGGDEFAVLMPDTPASSAAAGGQRLLDRINAAVAIHGVSASIGVVTTTRSSAVDAILADADQLMYEAKTGGGNQTRAALAHS